MVEIVAVEDLGAELAEPSGHGALARGDAPRETDAQHVSPSREKGTGSPVPLMVRCGTGADYSSLRLVLPVVLVVSVVFFVQVVVGVQLEACQQVLELAGDALERGQGLLRVLVPRA